MFSHETVITVSLLPPLAVLVPALGAIPVAFIGGRNEKVRNLIAFIASLATLGIVLLMAFQIFGGHVLRFDTGLVSFGGAFSLKFETDAMGALFALIASLVWVAAVAHASQYMTHEENRTRFFVFLMVAEAATLGVFLVHDFFSLFIFFEVMGLAAYPLVVHSGTEKARSAATKYLFMAVCGGLSLLGGIFLYLNYAGTLDFIPPAGSAFLESPLKIIPVILLIAGFGVKAGIVPLHVWLPDAHPAAPSPASALLSGVMLKAGVYGIIRTVAGFFYLPAAGEEAAGELAVTHGVEKAVIETASISADIRSLGLIVIGIALITMLTGVVLAVLQSDIKRTLAYSSISQVGFILFGAGCFVYLGEEGAIGLAASFYHILNHALFKGCLFLAAGSIVFRNHELNIFNLGGLYSKMRFTTVFWCVAAMGIAGIPLFNGFASKTLLHHAIVEAQQVALEGGLPEAFMLSVAEILFVIACAGTVLYFSKLTYFIFFRRNGSVVFAQPHSSGASPRSAGAKRLAEGGAAHHEGAITDVPVWMLLGTAILAAGVIAVGVMPDLFLRYLLLPAVGVFGGLEASTIEHLHDIPFFTLTNIRDALIPTALGIAVFAAALALRLFPQGGETRSARYLKWPAWAGFNQTYVTGARTLVASCFLAKKACDITQSSFKTTAVGLFNSTVSTAKTVDGNMDLARSVVVTGVPAYMTTLVRGTTRHAHEALGTVSWAILDEAKTLTEKERELTSFIASDLQGTYDVLFGTYYHAEDVLAGMPEQVSAELNSAVAAEGQIKSRAIRELLETRAVLHHQFVERKLVQCYSRLFSRKLKNLVAFKNRKATVFSENFWNDISLGALAIALILVLFLISRLIGLR